MAAVTLTNVRGESISTGSLPEFNHWIRLGYRPPSGTVATAYQTVTGQPTEPAALETGGGGGGSYTDEQVRDVTGAALVAGANVTITPNDAGDTITIAASGGGAAKPTTPDLALRLVNQNTAAVLTYASVGMTDGAGLYSPFVIDVQGKIATPIARYYMLLSTNHAVGGGDGLFLVTAPAPSGPWTPYVGALGGARVYQDTVQGNSTETPSIVWNPVNGLFHIYYQQAGTGANQATVLATTADFITYERIGTVIADTDNSLTPGDGHTGYAKVYRLARNYWVAVHLNGGTGYSHRSVSYSYDGVVWRTDWTPYFGSVEASARNDRSSSPAGVLFTVNGRLWSLGINKEYTSGVNTGQPVVTAGPVAPNLTRWLYPPQVVWQPAQLWEAVGGEFHSPVVDDAGDLWFYYVVEGTGTAGGLGIVKAEYARSEGVY
jgi:hypothetical protein